MNGCLSDDSYEWLFKPVNLMSLEEMAGFYSVNRG